MEANKSLVTLDPWRVKPFADQPRKRFRGIEKLAESIRLVGQVTPILVTLCKENGFDAELVDGERRLQACRLKNLPITAAVEASGVSADDRFALAIAANFCRQDHDCIEIAEAIAKLKAHNRSDADIAGIFGKTSTWVAQHRALLGLHPDVQESLKREGDKQRQSGHQRRARGRMTLSLALLLCPLDQATQAKAARRIIADEMSMAAARNYIRCLGTKHGKHVGRERSPANQFLVLWNAVDNARHVFERYTTMPLKSLRAILEATDARQAEVLACGLEQLCGELAAIGKEAAKRGGR